MSSFWGVLELNPPNVYYVSLRPSNCTNGGSLMSREGIHWGAFFLNQFLLTYFDNIYKPHMNKYPKPNWNTPSHALSNTNRHILEEEHSEGVNLNRMSRTQKLVAVHVNHLLMHPSGLTWSLYEYRCSHVKSRCWILPISFWHSQIIQSSSPGASPRWAHATVF